MLWQVGTVAAALDNLKSEMAAAGLSSDRRLVVTAKRSRTDHLVSHLLHMQLIHISLEAQQCQSAKLVHTLRRTCWIPDIADALPAGVPPLLLSLTRADSVAIRDCMQAVAPVCDFHLDSTDHNAHSTGLDGLWAGVPLLTMPGERFAARVVRLSAIIIALALRWCTVS